MDAPRIERGQGAVCPRARWALPRGYFRKGLFQLRSSEWFHSAGSEEDFVEVALAGVEAEFGLLEEGGEAGPAQAVELLMTSLGVAPEALDAVDVDAALGEHGAVAQVVFVDPVVALEARLDEAVIGAEAVRVDLGRELDAALDDGGQR